MIHPRSKYKQGFKIPFLIALQKAHEDGFRYCYLSVPRDGIYQKYLNKIATCGRIVAMSGPKYSELNHDEWVYSRKHSIIRSHKDSNVALMLFKEGSSPF
jgi:hypothetical protein